jgi:pyruvate formate lyase activating enzyme
MKETLFYKKEKEEVICFLCNHQCRIKEKKLGICGVRKNLGGTLYSLNYGKIVSVHIDPIEKKPLFHFFPSSKAYSIASIGCNFKCGFCQNWQISQVEEAEKLGVESFKSSAEEVVEEAIRNNCKSISYTYTEPTIYFEFAFEVSKLAKERGLYNNFVTNGYMSKEALEYISPYLDAANVDLKSYREEFYRKICKASLKPVLDNIILMKKLNIWVEITTLIIPGLNDSEEELKDIAQFISSLDKNIPWHISRFHPDYKFLNFSTTSLSILERAYQIGKEKGLKFIYIGNIYTSYGENTYCPGCNKLLIKRIGFLVEENNIIKGRCNFCQEKIAGVFEDERN